MLALRSYLRRSTSCLRPVHRHGATNTAVPCRNLRPAASRRHFSDGTNGDPHQPTAATKPHLYLVLDDQKKDYGIYKLDVDADLQDGDVGSDSMTAPRRLPHPAHIRMEVMNDPEQSAQFAAAGGCIIATGLSPYQGLANSQEFGIVTILYDIKTPAMYVSLHPTVSLQCGYQVAVPVGKRLYLFDSYADDDDGFHCMTTAKDGEDAAADGEPKQRDWSWWPDSGSSRIGWSDSCATCYSDEQLPFIPNEIQAYAVRRRDRTIFVSAGYELPTAAGWRYSVDTFIHRTTGDDYKWARYGRWALPFKGHAHYDRQLNRWVGLHMEELTSTGYVSACDIPSSQHKEPNRTCSTEKILLDDPDRRRIDSKLVYMDERGEYCLFERLRLHGAAEKQRCLDDGEECLLRLTKFRLKYESDEPECLGIVDRSTRSYKVPRYRDDFEAQAFWI